jgi:DNA-binding MarR family transcriptional regulator
MAGKKATANKSGARSALENRALLAARALVDRMRALYRELEQMTGAPITLHRAMVCIGNDPGLPASSLANQLGMQKPAVSHVLKNLESRGWIERRRNDGDLRTIHIHCTQAGRQLLKATAGRAVYTLQRAVCRLQEEDLGKLAAGIEKLLLELPAPPAPSRSKSKRGKGLSA